jgi:CDP-diacylglycerol--glycerol-3-phosphate 3-phosphatidyltransferase
MSPRRTIVRLPNILSSSRFVLAVLFACWPSTPVRIGLIVVAAISDMLDGWLARRVHATSRWGALLDPIADRVFVLAAVGTFVFSGQLGTRGYFVLIMRDLATAVGFLVARVIPWLRPVVFKARWSGKLVTVLQLVTLAAVLLAPAALPLLLVAVAIISTISIVDYTLALWRARAT